MRILLFGDQYVPIYTCRISLRLNPTQMKVNYCKQWTLFKQSNEFTLDDVHKLSIRVHVVTVLPTWRSCTAPRRRPGP